MIHLKNTNLSNYCLKTSTFFFVISLFSGTVFSNVVMENENGEILGPDYKGEVYKCKTPNKTIYDVHSDGLQKVYRQGVISEEITWKNCEKNGTYKNYIDGFIYEEGLYKDDQKTGEWTLYNEETGYIRSIKNYKNNDLDGLSTVFQTKDNKVQDGVLESETEYKKGLKDGIQKLYREGELVDVKTYVQNTLNGEFTKYITLDEYRGQTHREILNLHNFFRVMGPRGWKYRKECPKELDKWDCTDYRRDNFVNLPNNTPLTIKGNYQSGVLQGLLTITDRNDGHVYTSINHFRGGKSGEYKITNKEGLVIYSVNCLRGGGDIPSEGNCLKDGEEIIFMRTNNRIEGESVYPSYLKDYKNQTIEVDHNDWYPDEKVTWKNGRKNGEYIKYCKNGNIKYTDMYKDNSLTSRSNMYDPNDCGTTNNTNSSNLNPVEKEVDKLKKDLKKLNPFKKG